MTYRVLDLFSGIGGFSLGLERTGGFETVAFCEIDPFCRRVLAKHWPGVPIYDDIRELTAERLRADGVVSNVLCGGFPCQDISTAGTGAGIAGARSGLWMEYARLIGEIRPLYAVVENVAALLGRGLGRVLGDLAAIGYDAEWHCIPAAAVNAPHRRDRVWIVAYAGRGDVRSSAGCMDGLAGAAREAREKQTIRPDDSGAAVADSLSARLPVSERETVLGARRWIEGRAASERDWWAIEPDVGRVAHGVSARVDRLRSLGNAVVPQIPEIIGRALLATSGLSGPPGDTSNTDPHPESTGRVR